MKSLARLYASFRLTSFAYYLVAGIVLLFVVAFAIPGLLQVAKLLLAVLVVLCLIDFLLLYARRNTISIKRDAGERFSNGDENPVSLVVINHYTYRIKVVIVDELPVQFQLRNWSIPVVLEGGERRDLSYTLRPMQRGEYEFGRVHAFVQSPLHLVQRRISMQAAQTVRVFPSYLQMKRYQLLSVGHRLDEMGARRLRKLGNSLEFEQIRDYVPGDDFRTINWKATARRGQVMINTFTDEKSQHIYCLIDKGRTMKMPFEGLSLLDYAINASLVLTNVALLRQDKAGLITFSNKVDSFLPADRKQGQMENVLDMLYNQGTHYFESDFEVLYEKVRNRIKNRSLLVLFTNFESVPSFERQLPYLKQIAKFHLLLVVFFENTELRRLREENAQTLEDIYIKTIADKFAFEKRLIVKELRQHGILSLLTPPQQVTVNAINKYIELKARQAG